MKGLMVVYVLVWGLVTVWAIPHAEDTDENGYFKVQWRWLVWFAMVLGLLPFGKICGL